MPPLRPTLPAPTARPRPSALNSRAGTIRTRSQLAAVLVIAKLDRLARNVHFVSGRMEAALNYCRRDAHFEPGDRPILAAVAEEEARMISARTKAALGAARHAVFQIT